MENMSSKTITRNVLVIPSYITHKMSDSRHISFLYLFSEKIPNDFNRSYFVIQRISNTTTTSKKEIKQIMFHTKRVSSKGNSYKNVKELIPGQMRIRAYKEKNRIVLFCSGCRRLHKIKLTNGVIWNGDYHRPHVVKRGLETFFRFGSKRGEICEFRFNCGFMVFTDNCWHDLRKRSMPPLPMKVPPHLREKVEKVKKLPLDWRSKQRAFETGMKPKVYLSQEIRRRVSLGKQKKVPKEEPKIFRRRSGIMEEISK